MKDFTFYPYNRWFCKNILRIEYKMHETACDYFFSSVFFALAPIFFVVWAIIACGIAFEFSLLIGPLEDPKSLTFIPMVNNLEEIYANYYGFWFKYIPFALVIFVPLLVGLVIGVVLGLVMGFIGLIAPLVLSLAIGSIPFLIVGLVTYALLKDKVSLTSILSKAKSIASSFKTFVFSWLKFPLGFFSSLGEKLCKPMDFSRYD